MTQAGPALRLHLWRRLDFRFLLSDLPSGTVAVGGTPDEELLKALPLLVPRVRVVRSAEEWRQLEGRCALVILARPRAGELGAATTALRPGGWVYAEVQRNPGALWGPRTLRGWHRAFRRSGLDSVTAHWHAPRIATSSRIISLDAPAVIRDALGRHQAVRFGALLSMAGGLALRTGVFPLTVPEGSVVGRRPPGVRTAA